MFGNAIQLLNVIDPCNRTGKIQIPLSCVTETKGVTDWLRYGQNPPPDAKDLSLCLLFQRGRCNAGSRCNQVHAAPDFVETLRQRVSAVKNCCAKHGDVHSTSLDGKVVRVQVSSEPHPQMYSVTDFALTEALDVALHRARDGLAKIPGSRICRLHQKGSCKFGKDCKNIHLCPNAVPLVAETPAAPVAVPKPKVYSPPQLGISFRVMECSSVLPVDELSTLTFRDVAPWKAVSRENSVLAPPQCQSILSMEEFHSFRKADHDPLDILDNASTLSDVSALDFDAFVDALVECETEKLASPNWIAAP